MSRFKFGLAMVAVAALLAGCSRKNDSSASNTVLMKGSDTLTPLAQKWAEEYHEARPEISIEASGGGTGVGIKALIDGQCDIATASDEMTPEQVEEVKTKTGKDRVEYKIAYDALAVYVNVDNPIKSISIEEMAEIYGEGGKIEKWSDLDPSYPDKPIVRVGRQNSSGTYKYFHDHVCGKKRPFKQGTLERNGSNDVVQVVIDTPTAIGYSGMAFKNDKVKAIAISKKKGEPGVESSVATALDGTYPLARALYLYTAGQPEGEIKKFIDWTLSADGQKAVADVHFVPLKK